MSHPILFKEPSAAELLQVICAKNVEIRIEDERTSIEWLRDVPSLHGVILHLEKRIDLAPIEHRPELRLLGFDANLRQTGDLGQLALKVLEYRGSRELFLTIQSPDLQSLLLHTMGDLEELHLERFSKLTDLSILQSRGISSLTAIRSLGQSLRFLRIGALPNLTK